MLRIRNVSEEGNELDLIRELFREYEKDLNENICFQSFEAELEAPLIKYGAPAGDLILAYWNNEPAGCIALTKMKEDGACEMKRLYVKPAFRKFGIGKILVERVLASAKAKGYSIMRLDTLSKLNPAIQLYKKFGFKQGPPYNNNPLQGVVYMEKDL